MAASTLGFALLGLLARRPMTGYQLAAALKAPLGYFWSAGHSQIYPELARLEAAGLVRYEEVAGPGPRTNKRYRTTAAGRRALGEWAGRPAAPDPSAGRDEFLLKVYSSWLADPAEAIELVATRRAEHAAALATYRHIKIENERLYPAELNDPRTPEFANYATVTAGVSYEQHAVAWCDWLLGQLGRRAAGEPVKDESG